ncbi:MAG: hypothetical protein JW811_04015 [Clostridiales bacterium]|nr:hypothetical protein [Clostridiales bacterium]
MNKQLRAALVYSAMIIATVVTVNLLTSPGFLWFVFPVFGLLWWPLSVYFAGKKKPFAYAVCGAALLCGLFLVTYLLTSPGAHPWFIYPMLGVVWWPLSVYFTGKKKPLPFALLGFAVIAALFVLLWVLTGTGTHPWFVYPILGVFWWPLSVWGAKKGARAFAVAGGLYTILMLLAVNLVTSPAFWWWVYPAFFALWWPASVLLGKRANTLAFALGSSVAASLFLIVMYFIQTPNAEPWYLYALLPLFWWPVCTLLRKRVSELRILLISVIAFTAYYTGLIALLHGISSLLSVFLLIAGVWLVYAMSVSKHRNAFGFAAINAALLIAYFLLVHTLVTPDAHPWYWYTFFPLVWWPVTAELKEKAMKPVPVAVGAVLGLACYGALNWFVSPTTPWILFLSYPVAAAVIGSVCRARKAWVALSVWMTLAGIAYFASINLVYSPHTIWAVYPAFGLLWWPLSMLLFGRKVKDGDEETA